MTDALLSEQQDGVVTLTLNRPKVLNALDVTTATALQAALSDCERDQSVRVVVLRGSGRGFMAGGDIAYFAEDPAHLAPRIKSLIEPFHNAIRIIRRMPKPVIASVHGVAAGAGVSLAMACDLVLAAQSTRFTLAYSALGASPDGSSTYFLPRRVGFGKALELALLSDAFDAETAQRYNIVNQIVPDDTLSQETQDLAGRLANGPTLAYANIKALINQSLDNSLDEQLNLEADSFQACAKTADFREGVAAFLAKRQASFKGH